MSSKRRRVVDPPRQIAVIDCGTSEIRASIAEVQGGNWRVLDDVSVECDLSEAFLTGRLGRDTMDDMVRILCDVYQIFKGYGVQEVRAVATSALREAANTDVLLERLSKEFHLDVEVIDVAEESRLYFLALAWVLEQEGRHLRGDSLTLDVGSGGSVVSLIRNGKLVHSVDEHFSTLRSLENFRDLWDSAELTMALDRYSHGAARVLLRRLPSVRHPSLVVTGSEVRYLAELLDGPGKGMIRSVEVSALDAWYQKIRHLTSAERAAFCHSDVATANELLPVVCILRHLAEVTNQIEVIIPQLRLSDGLIIDCANGGGGSHRLSRQHLLAAARQMAVRYGSQRTYVNNTASLARQVFDQTGTLHGLGERERVLLEFAALVHDIGSHINVRSRHKHAFYLIANSDIAGMSEDEKTVVAHVARYHRRSSPRPSHVAFQMLPRETRVLVLTLAAILRLAYALDVERCQRIRKVTCRVVGSKFVMRVDRRDVTLERWSVNDKADLFADVFGLQPVISPMEEA